MNFNWGEYFSLAEELVRNDKESCWRSAISRAYYSVFCLARNKYDFTDEPLSHWVVIERYRNSENKEEKAIGVYLNRIKLARNIADYQNKSLEKKFAVETIEKARELLKLLHNIK